MAPPAGRERVRGAVARSDVSQLNSSTSGQLEMPGSARRPSCDSLRGPVPALTIRPSSTWSATSFASVSRWRSPARMAARVHWGPRGDVPDGGVVVVPRLGLGDVQRVALAEQSRLEALPLRVVHPARTVDDRDDRRPGGAVGLGHARSRCRVQVRCERRAFDGGDQCGGRVLVQVLDTLVLIEAVEGVQGDRAALAVDRHHRIVHPRPVGDLRGVQHRAPVRADQWAVAGVADRARLEARVGSRQAPARPRVPG